MTQPHLDWNRDVTVPPRRNDLSTVRAFLEAHPNTWLSLIDFRDTGVPDYSVTARIRDLRKPKFGGLQIANKTRREQGRCHSFYRLVVDE